MTLLYAVLQFFFWVIYGTATCFNSVYLLDCGLSNTAIGVIAAAACGLSIVLQPLAASLAERGDKVTVKTLLLALTGLTGLLGLALWFARGHGAALNGLLLGCAILAAQIALPLTNALATESINAGERLNFSLARGVGSAGFAVMSLTVGRLAARYGASVVPAALAGASLCAVLACAAFPFRAGKNRTGTPSADASGDGAAAFFRRYPALTAAMAGCILIYTSHMLINSFAYQIVTSKGGTSEHMGTAMALAGVLEVLPMFGFAFLLRWRDSGFWFKISGVFFTLKALGTLLAGSMPAFYAVQLFQPLGWGLLTVSCVYYVNAQMQDRDKIKGQAYMTMTLSIATVLASLTGGWLIDRIGVVGMLLCAIAAGAAGTAVVLRATARAKENTESPQ